jgi:two-component system sensor histidine kinase KdpD
VRLTLATLVVLAAAAFGELSYRLLHITHVALVYSGAVMVVALWLGPRMSYYSAVLAYVAFDYMSVEPRYKILFTTIDDGAVLLEFVGIAILTGIFANSVRRESERNRVQAEQTNLLFRASSELSNADDEGEIREILARHVSLATGEACLVAHEGRLWASNQIGPVDPDLGRLLADPATGAGEAPAPAPVNGWRFSRLAAKDEDFGVAAWRGDTGALLGETGGRLISILLTVGASAIERARLSEHRAEVETLVRTERLRDALLSSISHDLRTPLTAITASVTSLIHFGELFSQAVRQDLLITIKEEADRLNRFVGNLLSMTRLESGVLTFEAQVFDVREVLQTVAANLRQSRGVIDLTLGDDPLCVAGDPILLEQAITNITENALRYAAAGKLTRIAASLKSDAVVISIEDEGPGVATHELDKIFEKFYRSPKIQASTQGTGLGLSISRGLVDSMGGTLTARPRANGSSGLVVEASFPRAEAAQND